MVSPQNHKHINVCTYSHGQWGYILSKASTRDKEWQGGHPKWRRGEEHNKYVICMTSFPVALHNICAFLCKQGNHLDWQSIVVSRACSNWTMTHYTLFVYHAIKINRPNIHKFPQIPGAHHCFRTFNQRIYIIYRSILYILCVI